MYVTKRDGRKEKLNLEKIRKQTYPACEGVEKVSPEELEFELSLVLKDGISTEQIQSELIKISASKVTVDNPQWLIVSSRLALYDLYHKVKHQYNKAISGNVYELISLRDYLNKAYELGITKYSAKDFEEMGFDLDELNDLVIKNTKKDLNFHLMGINVLINRYLLKDFDHNVIELPQHMFMHIAMMLASVEKDKNFWAKKFYNVLNNQEFMIATPSLQNMRKKFSNCFSCYVGVMEDSIEGIMDSYKEMSIISKWGGGLGWDFSDIRSLGGPIQNYKDLAKGKIPWMKIANDLMIAVDQLGSRPGSLCAYCSVWDKDIFDFLDTKKSGGEERRTCEDLFLGVVLDDVFLKQAEKDEDYWLFDPYDVRDLITLWGEEFEKRYWEYVKRAEENPDSFYNPPKKVKARDIMRYIIKYMYDVGMPFLFFKDNVNKAHKHKEEGTIRTSNLCQEICQPTSPEETAVCNLGSINLAKVNTPEKIKEVVPIAIRMLDNVIDVTDYLLDKHKRRQKRTRALGLGIMGEAEYIANKSIMYGSQEHKELIDKLYKEIYSIAEETSKELAKEKGEWKAGKEMRNAYIGAVAPTSSISHVCATTSSHEPVFKRIWIEDGIFGRIPMVAPKLNVNNYYYYIDAYSVDTKDMIDLVAIKQKYVDQAISFNLYYNPGEVTGKDIFEHILYAWKKGVKTIYYTRTASKKIEKETDTITCYGCE